MKDKQKLDGAIMRLDDLIELSTVDNFFIKSVPRNAVEFPEPIHL